MGRFQFSLAHLLLLVAGSAIVIRFALPLLAMLVMVVPLAIAVFTLACVAILFSAIVLVFMDPRVIQALSGRMTTIMTYIKVGSVVLVLLAFLLVMFSG